MPFFFCQNFFLLHSNESTRGAFFIALRFQLLPSATPDASVISSEGEINIFQLFAQQKIIDVIRHRLPLADSVYERLHIRLQLFRQSDPLLWRDQHQKMVYITVVFSDMAGISFLTTFLASG